ncbi:MAG: 1-deoxy-D-xylulose-5-phosphate reductoisomerase [Acidimicrobiia bacterium]|nr:1-deoxy-D-xylulose-5-phosphate reductoisomerase [Acidimicrobiia bacterium]
MSRTTVAIAGSSGSVGTQTIDVIAADPGRYEVTALSVSTAADTVVAQARALNPQLVVVADETARRQVASELPGIDVSDDPSALAEAADVVVNGIVGFAGLAVTVATLRAGKRLALANKESLIAAGPVVAPLRSTPGAELVPVDSEHCAIHQCLRAGAGSHEVARLLVTASGGPFRGRTLDDLADATVDEALAHPTWSMGPKITVDSSTLMNKGLEVIEAHELFGLDFDQIDVVVHPQSVVHSMVEYTDGSTIAQLGMPDMRLPIEYALAYPDRGSVPFGRIDWSTLGSLDFDVPDMTTFRCLALCYEAGRIGGTAPAWLSAANEVAVDAFLDRRIGWRAIADVCDAVISRHDAGAASTLDDIIDADRTARRLAVDAVTTLERTSRT